MLQNSPPIALYRQNFYKEEWYRLLALFFTGLILAVAIELIVVRCISDLNTYVVSCMMATFSHVEVWTTIIMTVFGVILYVSISIQVQYSHELAARALSRYLRVQKPQYQGAVLFWLRFAYLFGLLVVNLAILNSAIISNRFV